jgi:crotonobetainyl-CoA:carnitine CoA-transferase CaiB-like acyl-CoA transferase
MPGPLDGILVVSLEQAVAAPFLTSRLADAGARVIKLERTEGDFARGYDETANGQSSFFVWLNRGKESVTVDIKNPADKALVERLIAKADVWVQNLAPGAMERAGLGSRTLRERHRSLITVDISGYGEVGPPYDTMKAYDLLVQAESGLAAVTGSAFEPGRVGVSACDISTGMFCHSAVLEALFAREKTGEGKGIKASLFASMTDWMAAPVAFHEHGDKPWPRMALAHPTMVPYGAYKTGDGASTLVACQNEREWARFCETVLQNPGLALSPGFSPGVERVKNRDRVNAAIDAVLSTIDRDELAARLRKADIAFGRVNEVADVAKHPALRRITVDTPKGEISLTAPAVYYDGEPPPAYGPVPGLGQHSEAVRKEFA